MERRTEIIELTRPQIEAIVREHLPGETTRGFKLLQGGRANTNYAIETDSGLRVLRLYVRDPAACGKEVAISALLADLPVPRILARGLIGHPFTILEYLPGQTLAALAAARSVPEATARNLGRVLARIAGHTFDTSGDLRAEPDGRLHVEPWGFGDDALLGFVKWCLFDSPAGTRLGTATRDKLWRITQARSSPVASGPPRLVHGDFNPTNILIDEAGQVSGVLDWEFAHAGDPIADVANLLRQRAGYELPDGFIDGLLQGLTDEGVTLPPDWREQAVFIDLTSALDFLSSAEDKPVTHTAAKAQIERFLADHP